ncbi:TonB-dependent receptor [Kordiimonas sediminis]|uniref:TonB-dependent receptor n=1 Tax=Kordiimonas sediminis TaxID=1735581 RepID=A0A919AWL1_9PROT|nr:TonB-dependent receptor [Kordiimonas sediminis]GHF26990.1 TonB-dependent receptor [Kordiimonas sediminis]
MKSSTFLKSALMAGVALPLGIASATSVSAQEAAADAPIGLEEIMVTARRRSESLQDVPIAVTAFSGSDLEMQGTADITELALSAPSVTLEASRATNSTLTAFIRGVGQQDPLAGFEQGVALYVDDIYMARPQAALLDVYDVERIEVLRGPQGTLYGRNAVGGAIKYVTKRLSDEPELKVKGNLGTYEQIDAIVSASYPVSDTFRIGGAVASLNRGGFGEYVTNGDEHYNKSILAGRISAELMPSDSLFIRLAADYTKDKSNPKSGTRVNPGAVSGLPVLDSVFDTYADAQNHPSTAALGTDNDIEAKGVNASIEWEVNPSVTLKSITAYREDYSKGVIDFDSLPIDDMDTPGIYDNEQFSQEFQLAYTGDKLTGLIGFFYLDASASNEFDVVLGQLGRVAFGSELAAYTYGLIDTKAWSVFGDMTYEVTEKLSLSFGGRYTNDKRDADVFRENYLGQNSPAFGSPNAIGLGPSSDFEASKTFKDFSPRVVLDYKLNDDVTVYGGFSQGFKAGSFDPRGANFIAPEVVDGFDPETLNSFEAGLKATFADGRIRTNIAVFHSKYKDMQIPGSIPVDSDGDGTNDGFVGSVTNAGKATIKGIEFEGDFLLTENLTMRASMSALDAEIDEWLVEGVNIADQREIQNTPSFTSYVGLNYAMDIENGTVNFLGNWSYKSSIVQFETPVPEIDQDGYSLFNASIVWTSEDNKYTIGLHGKNLFDKLYKTSGYNFPTLGLENNITAFYGPPRTVTASFGVKF